MAKIRLFAQKENISEKVWEKYIDYYRGVLCIHLAPYIPYIHISKHDKLISSICICIVTE